MKSMTISIAGEASIKENTVVVDYSELRELVAINVQLLEALKDMRSGWRYIRETHGDLPGVGWERAENKANEAIEKAAQ